MKNQLIKWIGVYCTLVSLMLVSTTSLVAQYCEFSGTTPANDHLTNITFAGINNTSGPSGYSDFTDISGTVTPNETYDISATIGNSDTWTETLTVYIDWDQSETFDADERYEIGSCTSTGCATTGVSGSITVPVDALSGETRMRAIVRFVATPVGPCTSDGVLIFGEVEDYSLFVEGGVCTPPNFTFSLEENCEPGSETYDVSSILNGYGSNTFITVFVTRSDGVSASNVNIPPGLPLGSLIPIIDDVPADVTVSLSIQGQNPICNLTRVFESTCFDCVPPVVPPGFTYADTQPFCEDGVVGYTLAFYSPEDLGSNEFFIFRYSYEPGDTVTINVSAGGTYNLDDVIPLETETFISIDLSDENCAEESTGFPVSGLVTQDEFACDPDCEGTLGGDVGPGGACEINGVGGLYSEECECVESPVNDACTDAIAVICGSTYTGSTEFSTSYPEDQPFCETPAPSQGNGGVWFSYTPTNDTDVEIDLSGSEFDTKLFLYSGTCDALICEDGDDDGGDVTASRIEANLTGGTNYFIYVTGYLGNRGEFILNISCTDLLCSPTISSINLVDAEGETVECAILGEYYLEVTLLGGTGTSYQLFSGSSPVTTINADGTGIVGPITSANPTITVVGTDDTNCGVTASFQPEVCPPTNDFPCDAIAVTSDGVLILGSNIGASADSDEVSPPQGSCNSDSTWCDNFGELNGSVDNSVWFTFVGPESGRVRIDGCNESSSFDSQFAVYTATDCNDYSTFNLVGANDDAPLAVFGSCDFGLFRAGLELCIEPGETYYLQVDGYNGVEGTFGITLEGIDDGACSCEPPVVPTVFTFADTDAFCEDGVVGYNLSFFAPNDLGSSEFFIYRYSYIAGDTLSINVPAGGSITLADVIPLGTLTFIEITLSDANCALANTGFPITGSVVQDDAACDPDCEGTLGGDALPGTPCDDGNPLTLDDSYNNDCECIGNIPPVNDEPCNATDLECGLPVQQTTLGATSTLPPTTCQGFTAAQAFDVWFSFTADGSSSYILNETQTSDLVLEAFSSDGCNELVSIACADFPETIDFGVLDAGVYYVRAYAYSNLAPSYDIDIQLNCEANDAAVFNGNVGWNSNCDDRESVVTFYEPNTATVAASYTATVNSAGNFTIPNVLIGTYDIIVDVPGFLDKGQADVVIVAGTNTVNFGPIVGGDGNNSNSVNIADFSGLNAAFGSVAGDANYNLFADFNCSGTINIADFSGLNAAFGQGGAVAPLP